MLTTLLPIALIASPPPALAWGNVGHPAIANLAQPNLQPAVWSEIQGLLALGGATNLADVASWADSQRLRHATRLLHHAVADLAVAGVIAGQFSAVKYPPLAAQRMKRQAIGYRLSAALNDILD